MRLERALVVVGIAWSTAFFAPPAAASEVHFAGDDVRVTVDGAGLARVEHALAYRVAGGARSTPEGFDLTGVEPEAVVDPVAPVAIDGETANAARVERRGDRVLRVTFEGGARQRGRLALVVRVRYAVDLVRARELVSDGAMWHLAWTAPVAPEGFDAARVVFDLPGAPTEPRAISLDGAAIDDERLVTLRRGPERDELEMARPHVARSEAAVWTARVDPRAFPRVVDPSMRPSRALPEAPAPARGSIGWLLAALAGVAFGGIVRAKSRSFARACAERGLVAEGLVARLPGGVRAWLAGGMFAAGVAFEAVDLPAWGAAAVVLAMGLAVHRAPAARFSPRGPGQWLALAPAEAFARDRASDALDAATRAGKCTTLLAALGSLALGLALRPIDPAWAWLVPLDALALVAVLVTGSRAQLPPDRASAPRRRLASLHRVLKRDRAIRVAPWARVPLGASAPDELRLLILPRAPMPGVVGIEVGVAWVPTPAGYAPETEVLVRVRDESAAAARLFLLAPRRRTLPGRKPDERVLRLVPALASRACAIALVRRLARELHDRRKTLPGATWGGAERRLPPNERLRAPAGAAAVAA